MIDDGSADDTMALSSRYPEMRWIRQRQQGVSAARNRGIREARFEWLAFLDSDDEWRPGKLERQLQGIGSYKVCHTDEIWIRNGRRVNPRRKHAKHGGQIFRHCLALCAISPSSVLLHREVFAGVGLFDEALPACEDYDLWLRVCSRFAVRYLDQHLVVKHGGHDDQLSRRFWGMDRFRITALEKIIAEGVLDPEDLAAANESLRGKIEIYLLGARKRGRVEDVALYEAKLSGR